MQVTDGAVVGSLDVNLITIHIEGIQYFQGLSIKSGNLLLDTILVAVSTATFLFKYQGEQFVVHSKHLAPLGRVLAVLLGR